LGNTEREYTKAGRREGLLMDCFASLAMTGEGEGGAMTVRGGAVSGDGKPNTFWKRVRFCGDGEKEMGSNGEN